MKKLMITAGLALALVSSSAFATELGVTDSIINMNKTQGASTDFRFQMTRVGQDVTFSSGKSGIHSAYLGDKVAQIVNNTVYVTYLTNDRNSEINLGIKIPASLMDNNKLITIDFKPLAHGCSGAFCFPLNNISGKNTIGWLRFSGIN